MAEKTIKAEYQSIVPPKARSKPVAPAGKPAGFFAGFLSCLLVFILVLGAFAAAFWFDLGDIRTMMVTTLRLSEIEFRYLETRHSELAVTEADLMKTSQKLTADQMALEVRSKDLEQNEAALTTRASELENLAASLSEKKASLMNVVAIYEAMEPATAAAILTVPADLEENLLIIKNLNKNKLALILAEMTPEQAAAVLAMVTGDAAGSN